MTKHYRLPRQTNHRRRSQWILVALLVIVLGLACIPQSVRAQESQSTTDPTSNTITETSTTTLVPSPTDLGSEPATSTATISEPSSTPTDVIPPTNATSTSSVEPARTPGPAINPFNGTGSNNDCTGHSCGPGQECFVFNDTLACLPVQLNWGFILARNASGMPGVPSWNGQRMQLGANCSLFQVPSDAPGLAETVYEWIQQSIPENLIISENDERNGWTTRSSNCDPSLACFQGICRQRPALGQACVTSWQCNYHAMGLDDSNQLIPEANSTSSVRCEYLNGYGTNTTCQLLFKKQVETGSQGSTAWHIFLPIILALVLFCGGSILYKQKMQEKRNRSKWQRVGEDESNDYTMDTYDRLN